MTLAPGEVFAGYTIQRRLGAGGMGEVYLAQHPRLPRPYALKVLSAPTGDDPGYRERFIREADLAATLSHPNVVGVHDRGEVDDRLWIAMDYVEGTDAAQLLRQRYPTGMPLPDVVEIVGAVGEALDYAHSHALLHRDIKPANILLSNAPAQRRRILLADFGIARRTDDVSGLTATNMTVGTLAYAAPEQLSGDDIDGRADQYALAATAYQLLTGQPPFQHSNAAVTIGMHLTAPPPSLAERRPELAYLDPVFAVALAKRPDARFPSCTAFADALAGRAVAADQLATQQAIPVAAGAPTVAAPVWPSHPAAVRDRGRAVKLVIPLVLVLLLIGATAFAATQFLRPEPQTPVTKAQWQPYVDTASSYVHDTFTYTPDTADAAVERQLATSTGALHEQLAGNANNLTALLRANNVSSSCTINGAGLESLNGTEASVLVAAHVTVTDSDGQAQPAQPYRLRLTVQAVDGTLKVAELKYPEGGN